MLNKLCKVSLDIPRIAEITRFSNSFFADCRRHFNNVENSDNAADRSKIKEGKILAYNKVREFFTTRNFAIRRPIDEFSRGRSMIEMLGVLAIVGVLSVGGLAGYSKAMHKYKINKTIEQLTQIYANVKMSYAEQQDYDGLGDYYINEDMVNSIIPEDMINNNYGATRNMWNDQFGHGLNAFTGDYDNYESFAVALNYIPYEACVELSSLDWTSNSDLVSIGIAKGTGYTGPSDYSQITGEDWVHYIPRKFLPLTPSEAASYCSFCKGHTYGYGSDGNCCVALYYK